VILADVVRREGGVEVRRAVWLPAVPVPGVRLALPELPPLVVMTVTMAPVATGPGVVAPAVVVEVEPA
jgi:hypothetical protein